MFQKDRNIYYIALVCLICLIAFCFVGCVPDDSIDYSSISVNGNSNVEELVQGSLRRYIDRDAGEVCWLNIHGGIYCKSIEDTKLK